MPIIFITGSTAGFGKAIALKFAEHGYDVIINGRRTDRLKTLEEEIKNTYGVKVFSLPFDVRDKKAVEEAIHSLPHDWKNIDVPIVVVKENKYGKYNALAGFNRNQQMAEYADVLIAIIKNNSSGTRDMIERMNKLNKKVYVLEV